MSHATKDWSAVIHDKTIAGGTEVSVSGMVETHSTAEKASLVRATPQGINAKVLLLDLIIKSEGIGGEVIGWAKVNYSEASQHGAYTSVEIKTDGVPVEVKIIETHS